MADDVTITLTLLGLTVVLINLPYVLGRVRLYSRRGYFSCSLCGNCCRFRYTPITQVDKDLLEAAGYTGYTEDGKSLKRENGRCMFLKDDSCTAYDSRPKVCRDFPFFKSCGIGYARRASFCPAMEKLENG